LLGEQIAEDLSPERSSYQAKTLNTLATLFEDKPSLLGARLLDLKQTGATGLQELRNALRARKLDFLPPFPPPYLCANAPLPAA
jgi:hypothetical protein